MTQLRKRNPGWRAGASDAISGLRALYGTAHSTRLPANWRDRLPDPAGYYGQHVAKLGKPNGSGWAQGRCPLHEDRHESLSVNLGSARGFWRCFAGCGKGDLVSFHERLTGKPFKDAVAELLGVAQ